MYMQGVGGSRDQQPRDIFEEYVMTVKVCFFFFWQLFAACGILVP